MVIKTPRERYFHSFMLHFDNSGGFSRQSIVKSSVIVSDFGKITSDSFIPLLHKL